MSVNENRIRAISLRKQGETTTAIALRLGVSRERVCQYLRPEGLAKRVTIGDKYEAKIKEMGDEYGPHEIALRLGISTKHVSSILGPQEAGIRQYRRAEKLVGKEFPGSILTILSVSRDSKRGYGRKCEVRCRCGTVKTVDIRNLKSGATKGCGCLLKERAFGNHLKVGKGMNLNDCQRLRDQLTEKYRADMEALDRVEEMLRYDTSITESKDENIQKMSLVYGKEFREAVHQVVNQMEGEFTIMDVVNKLKERGVHQLRQNIVNRVKALMKEGVIDKVGERDSGKVHPTYVYRKKGA